MDTMHGIPDTADETLVLAELRLETRQQGLSSMMERLLVGTIKGDVVVRFHGCLVEMRSNISTGLSDVTHGSGTFAPRIIGQRENMGLAFIFASAVVLNIRERLGEI